MSLLIQPMQRAENPVVQGLNDLGIRNSRPADLNAVAIDVERFVRAADNQGDWTGGRLIGVPFKLARGDWLALLAALREEQTRMHRFGRRGMRVGNDHRRAFPRYADAQ